MGDDEKLESGSERVVDEEVRFHLAERTAELIAGGADPEEARRRAEREFGDVEGTLAYCERQDRARARRLSLYRWMVALADDARTAVRGLARRPASVRAPFLVLTLGIALNALVFTVVRAVLLAPLPFAAVERVHVLEEVQEGGGLVRASYPVLARWRSEATSLEAVAGYTESPFPLTTPEGPIHVEGASVTDGFFELLDRPVLLGRGFTPADHRAGAAPVVLISESLWRRVLGARGDVLGVSLRLNGNAHEVVGVVRGERVFPDGAELWIPLEPASPELLEIAGAKILWAMGRLRPGISPEAVRQELSALSAAVVGGAPAAAVEPVADRLLGDVRTPLLLLQGAVLLVLLAACANAGGMLLARSVRRSGELAVRVSLGAGRLRVAGVLLSEGLALGLAGGVAGLVLAALLLEPTLALVPRGLPRADGIRLDGAVVAVALGLAALTGLVTALGPVLGGMRVQPAGLLRQASGATGGPPWLRRLLEGLVVAQVAFAMLLTAGAGLLVRSFLATVAEDPGFDPARVTVLEVSLPPHAYSDDAARLDFARALVSRAAGLPGATAVAVGRNLPITGSNMTSPLVVEGADGTTSAVQVAKVSAGYFEAMGIELVRGTDFGGEDREGGLPRLVVDESLRAPDGGFLDVGDRAHSFFGRQDMREVVGVARSVRHHGLREAPVATVYEPFFQSGGSAGFALVVRSEAPAAVVADAARALVRDLDPDLPADRVSTMSAHIRRSLAEPRFYLVGLSAFGVLAILLALAGCQAGLAHRVAARRRELGLRMALGASAPDVRAMVLKRGLALTGGGVALGTIAALPATRLLESQLYGVRASDPVTYAAVVVLLLLAGGMSSDWPARRAAAVDPVETLKEA